MRALDKFGMEGVDKIQITLGWKLNIFTMMNNEQSQSL